jgi:PST family polysaccharide transporter
MFLQAPQIVRLVLGHQYEPTIMVVRIMSFLPFIGSIGNILGTQLMINFGLSKLFARVITFAGISNVILAFIFIPIFQEKGIALAVLLTELQITVTMFIILELNKLSPRRKWVNNGI